MKLICHTHGGGDFGPSLCIVDIDPGDAKTLLARRDAFVALKAQDSSLMRFEFWDGADYYEWCDVESDGASIECTQWYEIADDLPEAKYFRSDVNRVMVDAEDATWVAIPKHGEEEFRSEPLTWGLIERIANGESGIFPMAVALVDEDEEAEAEVSA
jgi:hypothetical protein